MLLIHPKLLISYILFIAGIITLLFGLFKKKPGFLNSVPVVFSFILTSLLFFPQFDKLFHTYIYYAFIITIILNASLPLLLNSKDSEETFNCPGKVSLVLFFITIFICGSLLVYRLGNYSGTMLVWESPVLSDGFSPLFRSGTSPLTFYGRCLLWDDGLMSAGQHGLFYGPPAYAIFHIWGFNMWNFRICPVICTLLSVIIVYIIASRFFGFLTGIITSVVFALNSVVLFYGRYGTSSAGTMLAILIAILATWLFLDNKKPSWHLSLSCSIAFCLASLQYATARIVIILLIGFIVFEVLSAVKINRDNKSGNILNFFDISGLSIPHIKGIALIGITLFLFWGVQKVFHTNHFYFNARGEQFFAMCKDPWWIQHFMNRYIAPNDVTFNIKMQFLRKLLNITVPQYISFFSPDINLHPKLNEVANFLDSDPPKIVLYYSPFFVFFILGLVHSFKNLHLWKYSWFFLWVMLCTPFLLLTSRVDAHRLLLFVIPVTFWVGFGILEAVKIMKKAGVPNILQYVFAFLLFISLVYSNINCLYIDERCNRFVPWQEAMKEEIGNIRENVLVCANYDHRAVSIINLYILERMRVEPGWNGNLFNTDLKNIAKGENGMVGEICILDIEEKLKSSAIVFYPLSEYQLISDELEKRGYNVVRKRMGTDGVVIVNSKKI